VWVQPNVGRVELLDLPREALPFQPEDPTQRPFESPIAPEAM
jgi:hypothetical protein